MSAMYLPDMDELKEMSYADAVATLTTCIGIVIKDLKHRAAVRHAEGRLPSAADQRSIAEFVVAIEGLRLDIKERLEPGSTERAVQRAYAELANYTPNNEGSN